MTKVKKPVAKKPVAKKVATKKPVRITFEVKNGRMVQVMPKKKASAKVSAKSTRKK